MLGIFIVLMRILKELRNKDRTIYKNKNTHQINQSKSNRNESKDDYRNDARIRLIKRNLGSILERLARKTPMNPPK